MPHLVHQLIRSAAAGTPDAMALIHGGQRYDYGQLGEAVARAGRGLKGLGLQPGERVAVYLDKRPETVIGLFGAPAAGGVFVPVNPLLKPPQVAYMLADCNVRVLITSAQRLAALGDALADCPDLHTVVLVDNAANASAPAHVHVTAWTALAPDDDTWPDDHGRVDSDMAAILYTSGSTGRPKGVVLSHRNLVAGAHSVAEYLGNTAGDRLLAALPLSFDYGLSQLTTAFRVGASVVLLNYLLPRDVIRAVEKEGVTGLAAVPPLWVQLAELPWPDAARQSLRYLTNSGGAMPRTVLNALRESLPETDVVLMYGLTEAFRSTYLPPSELARRPDSMGRAIPNAEILVLREDGSPCAPGEPGELVHRGPLVSMGYWNDPERTAQRFRPLPGRPAGLPLTELAVWSGDTVRRDEDGFLYFLGRRDEMIKTSGYRVSPNEVEEVVYASGTAGEVAAFGVSHPALGQAIVLVVAPASGQARPDPEAVTDACRQALPAFMVPRHVAARDEPLPRNANGKIDRSRLRGEFADLFTDEESA